MSIYLFKNKKKTKWKNAGYKPKWYAESLKNNFLKYCIKDFMHEGGERVGVVLKVDKTWMQKSVLEKDSV